LPVFAKPKFGQALSTACAAHARFGPASLVLYGVSTLHFQMVGMQLAGLSGPGLVVATVVGAALCLIARWRGWILPERIDLRRGRRKNQSQGGDRP